MRRTTVHNYHRTDGTPVEQHTRRLDDVSERETFSKPAMTLDEVKQIFTQETRSIWGDKVADFVIVDYVIDPDMSANMAIHTIIQNRRYPQAIGSSLIRTNKNFTLHVKPSFLTDDRERIIKTIRHEVIHLGHFNHTTEFFKLAREKNATLTNEQEQYSNEPPYRAQAKQGSRFVTLKRFNTQEEATAFLLEYHKEHKGVNLRVLL